MSSSADWLVTFAPVIGLAVNVAVQVLAVHLTGRLAVAILGGFGSGLAATIAATFVALAGVPAAGPAAAMWLVAVATYLALSFCFWAFLNLNITSLRIRMLREILRSSEGISRSDLTARYSADEFLRRRLDRLAQGKQLSFAGDRWRLESRTLLVLARFLAAVRFLVLSDAERRRLQRGE